MDTDTLRWFQQVADGVTVTEVSEIEGVSQPGVSRALARLETEIGTPLLHRSGRTLTTTRAGYAFKRHVDALLHHLDDGLSAVEQVVDPEGGTVTLAFLHPLGAWLVPRIISSFQNEHPNVDFDLVEPREEMVTSILGRGHADIVISTVRPADEGVHRRRLMDEPLRLAVPSHHPLASDSKVRLAMAADESFVMPPPSSHLRQVCDELCGSAGFRPRVGFEVADEQSIRGFIAAGLGVAILPTGEQAHHASRGAVRYLEISDVHASREIGVMWSAERRLLPAAQNFCDHIFRLKYFDVADGS
jgi:LysR family transcriptional regulator, transcription activator of glutamate synthase operon